MYNVLEKFNQLLFKRVSIAPLVVLRLLFGSLLFYSTFRTWQKGWIAELYIEPTYHFSFISWIKPLSEEGNVSNLSCFMGLGALGIILGLFYRASTLLFLLLFTYTELLDKTYYLNHYYLVSLLCFWLALVPANRWYSLDTLIFP